MQAEAAATSPKPFKDAPEVSGEPVAAGGLPAAAAMLLEHEGELDAAKRLMKAIERVTGEGKHLPRDLGGTATSREVTDAVLEAIQQSNE